MTPTTNVSVTLSGVTPAQFEAITKILKGKNKAPEKTVSDDEDEAFGTKALKKKNLEDEEKEDAHEEEAEDGDEDEDEVKAGDTDDEDENEDTDSDEDSPSVTFKELKAAINKYGEKHPDQTHAILKGFKIAGPKDLASAKNEKHWDAIFQKFMAKIKASKKVK